MNARRAAEFAPRVRAALQQIEESGRDAAPVAEVAVLSGLRPMEVGFTLRLSPELPYHTEQRDGKMWVVAGDFARPLGVKSPDAGDVGRAPSSAAPESSPAKSPGFLDWLWE